MKRFQRHSISSAAPGNLRSITRACCLSESATAALSSVNAPEEQTTLHFSFRIISETHSITDRGGNLFAVDPAVYGKGPRGFCADQRLCLAVIGQRVRDGRFPNGLRFDGRFFSRLLFGGYSSESQ